MTTGGEPHDTMRAQITEASERAARLAQAASQLMNLSALLAAPRVLLTIPEAPTREHILQHIDAFAQHIDTFPTVFKSTPAKDAALPGALARLRDACAAWAPGPVASPDVQEAARSLLAALGVPTPADGWDLFEAPQDEPEDPDPRPPPSPEEDAARPDGLRFVTAVEWLRYIGSSRMIAKMAPGAWARSAVEHVDTLLASYRPVRSHRASRRRLLLDALEDLEALRALCDAATTSATPPAEVRERARALLYFLNVATTDEECDAFEQEPSEAYR